MSRDIARQVLKTEADAIANLMENLGQEFDRAVELIYGCAGRVVLTGMGKSGTPRLVSFIFTFLRA